MMSVENRRIMIFFAFAFLVSIVESRAVNISNTWMLPEEGFPVFYRYFRDRISWYEADAVCQFHHANLVTADTSSQHDAIRAYLKELDIGEKVWIGLSKPQDKPNFQWTDFHPLSGEGHWQESIPTGDSQSLCAVMDPAADFLWKSLPCGGPEVAAFICELPIPSWALGPKGCLLTELPSLTVLYIPEQSALELTSDCGLDGTKRISCKGNADHEEMLKQLTCVIINDDIEDDKWMKTSTTSDYLESSTWDINNSVEPKTTKRSIISNAEYEGISTRHRRETENSLSADSTKSSFKDISSSSWHDDVMAHKDKIILTTEIEADAETSSVISFTSEEITTTSASTMTTTSSATNIVENNKESEISSPKTDKETTPIPMKISTENSSSIHAETNVEDYPSAINQGQLFSFIENGTMFDIIELNETDQHQFSTSPLSSTSSPQTVPTKKPLTKKPIQLNQLKKKNIMLSKILSLSSTDIPATTTKKIPTVDEIEENLTKEFEMMPEIKDTSINLKRTFRKEVPSSADRNADVPKILNFNYTVINSLDSHEADFQEDGPNNNHDDKNKTEELKIQHSTEITNLNIVMDSTTTVAASHQHHDDEHHKIIIASENHPLDPRILLTDHHNIIENFQHLSNTDNHTDIDHNQIITQSNNNNKENSTVTAAATTPKITKEDFLPKSLLIKKTPAVLETHHSTILTSENSSEFSSEEPKKINRHRSLVNSGKSKKFYPYFFSRMLG